MIGNITAEAFAAANEIAEARLKAKHEKAKNQRVCQTRDDLAISREGILAEMAVAAFLGLDYNPQALPGGDGKRGDLVMPTGESISVKRSNRYWGDFVCFKAKEFQDDYGVLVYPVHASQLLLAGWTTRAIFQQNHVTKNYGHGDRAVLPNTRANFNPDMMALRNILLRQVSAA